METVGRVLLGSFGAVALLAFPATEFARGMASVPQQHPINRASCVMSIIGIALIVVAVFA